eukprot:gene24008-32415_t
MTSTSTSDVTLRGNDYQKSFIQDELRPYAMKLHTRDQAPKEGQQKAQVPVARWDPSVFDYLRFLVDSLAVYETLEEIVDQYPSLHSLRNTGLERSEALKFDIQWIKDTYSLPTIPPVGQSGLDYSLFLKSMASESIPKFMCHYYNHYFAHTAGGRMIGKRLGDLLLDGKVLRFYMWDGDVKQLLEDAKSKIDVIAETWSAEEKQACLEETIACFRFGGSLMVYLKPPATTTEGGASH